MLNSQPKDDKIKSELVFKLLKSMNPYIPNADNSLVKEQLLSIIQKSARQADGNIIHELTEEDEGEEQEEGYLSGQRKSRQTIVKFAREIASRVVDITVKNGNLVQLKTRVQSAIEKELEYAKQEAVKSTIIRRDIENIQNKVFSQFGIKKQQLFQPNQTSKYNYYSSSSSIIRNLPTARSAYGEYSHYVFKKSHEQQTRPNSSRDINMNNRNSQFEQFTEKISRLRLGLSQIPSAVKSYRHQNAPFTYRPNQYNSSDFMKNISQSNHKFKNNQTEFDGLGLQSIVLSDNKSSSRLRHCQSLTGLPLKLMKNREVQRKKLSKDKKVEKSIMDSREIPRSKSTLFLEPRTQKISNSLTKQAQKLDIEVMASMLHQKINRGQKINTISSLLK